MSATPRAARGAAAPRLKKIVSRGAAVDGDRRKRTARDAQELAPRAFAAPCQA